MIPAAEALTRLRDGNRRFLENRTNSSGRLAVDHRMFLVDGQHPFAIILGCSDSRVPAELVFDQGFGDLFVIRVAGNIVAPSQIGSVEFAASKFGTRLVVVLGHSQCGAILATVDHLLGRDTDRTGHLRSIVDRIRPSVEPLLPAHREEEMPLLVSRAVRANVNASVNHLRYSSELLENLIENDGLLIEGAEYSLETGIVRFYSGGPDED